MTKRVILILFFFFINTALLAQQSEKVRQYIAQYKGIAIAEMKRTGVPAAITLAQGIHESGIGESKLAIQANNHFGIKCKSNWTGESFRHTDDAKNECFRKYASAEDSYKDHSDFLKNGQRYAFLFNLDPADYASWANGLKQAGYATNPKYSQVLIKLIEDYELLRYSLTAMQSEPFAQEAFLPEDIRIEKAPATQFSDITPKSSSNGSTEKKNSYPKGEFKINDTKVIYAKKGESFLSIAKQYKIDLAKLFEVNELNENEISDKDQLIYLQRKRKTGASEFHVVLAGETLHSIAQAEAIRLESLLELNGLNVWMQPATGEKISLRTKRTSVPKLVLKDKYTVLPPPVPKGAN